MSAQAQAPAAPKVPAAPKERAPRRETAPKATPRQIASLATTVVSVANLVAGMLVAPQWREDLLTVPEQSLLGEAIASEIVIHPAAVALVSKAVAVARHGELAGALLLIATPRLVRHGLLPVEVLGLVGGSNGAGEGHTPTGPVGSGATPGDSRGHGERQVYPGGPATVNAAVPASA